MPIIIYGVMVLGLILVTVLLITLFCLLSLAQKREDQLEKFEEAWRIGTVHDFPVLIDNDAALGAAGKPGPLTQKLAR